MLLSKERSSVLRFVEGDGGKSAGSGVVLRARVAARMMIKIGFPSSQHPREPECRVLRENGGRVDDAVWDSWGGRQSRNFLIFFCWSFLE